LIDALRGTRVTVSPERPRSSAASAARCSFRYANLISVFVS
jgi:hypothetical protein